MSATFKFPRASLVLSAPAGTSQNIDIAAHGSRVSPTVSSSLVAASVLAGIKDGDKEGAGLTWVRQGWEWLQGIAGSGTPCQEHLRETRPASPPVPVLQALLTPVSAAQREVWGERTTASAPLQLSFCLMDALAESWSAQAHGEQHLSLWLLQRE